MRVAVKIDNVPPPPETKGPIYESTIISNTVLSVFAVLCPLFSGPMSFSGGYLWHRSLLMRVGISGTRSILGVDISREWVCFPPSPIHGTWDTTRYKRVVRILLECILVHRCVYLVVAPGCEPDVRADGGARVQQHTQHESDTRRGAQRLQVLHHHAQPDLQHHVQRVKLFTGSTYLEDQCFM